ncbi:Regulator of protease activity HflC, stomatin/prohibitin superfamily [Nonomuraea solani]|uniref:Regulator of protease activity HflC, stomatin/prohibitin superfamily n=1 Tax=Nonomuraea solani TaxID=1144553 RepID=A0A1H6EFV4_9ACTN|nr:SPFH domain-containing protein [Nonomuraea solani]SEG96680.1 Regulator of protease activity HflC, stomatin/prohibitin superfamily [Nonomuraea solani]
MSTTTGKGNAYLDQVVAQQAVLEDDLRARRGGPGEPSPGAAGPLLKRERALGGGPPEKATPGPVDVRITGFWRWKNVLVPPNAFVVHTRRGRENPLHIGLGVSFRFNPATDSFLVVPGATQTILINAYCICRELQGVLVQGYVQWGIQSFSIAYRKLDFGDQADPMRLVNLQLREQAEAAIKDKVATMGVRDVLSDKQPIIEELTARLRAVAEGEDNTDQGLGLRIVTVQIKEAVVSSSRLWENLQKPYRAEQGQLARLAELESEEAVAQREMAAERLKETQRLEYERELAELRARNEAWQFDTEVAERLRRTQREHDDSRAVAELETETTRHALRMERERHAEEAETGRLRIERERELKRLELDGELELARSQVLADHERALLDVERTRLRADIDNRQTPASLQAKLIGLLPEIMAKLPQPEELRMVSINGGDRTTVSGLLAELAVVIGVLRSAIDEPSK